MELYALAEGISVDTLQRDFEANPNGEDGG